MSEFTWKRRDGIPFLTINSFSAYSFVINAFTTRRGGVSTGACSTLNMSWMVGDEPGNVLTNRTNICHALGAGLDNTVAALQVHGDRVAVVTAGDRGKGARGEGALAGVDAMITREKGIMLITCHADCVPVFLLDPVHRVIGLAHAGWKGTALRIAGKTALKMQEIFGSRPRDCLAGIGPSIGPCCYEVDEPVINDFQNREFDDWRDLFTGTDQGGWRLNLWEANRRALLRAGLSAGNIVTSKLCTACRQDLFFSHRGSGGKAGRMAALLMLIEEDKGVRDAESACC